MNSKLVFVHLGDKIPKHLTANLEYCYRTFPEVEIVLIHNAPSYLFRELRGVNLYRYEAGRNAIDKILSKFPKNVEFRSGFWLKTKLRFLALAEYIEETESSVVHIENDVWLAPYFDFEYLEKFESNLAFPRVDVERSIASVLFINGFEGAETLQKFTIDLPELTDMELLETIRRGSSSKVHSLFSSFDLTSDLVHNKEKDIQLFDGAAIGMHLFGADPRNNFGLLERFKDFPKVSPEMSKLQFGFNDDRFGILVDNDFLEIVSLHIHSKDISIFVNDYRKVLKKAIIDRKSGPKRSFLPAVFLYSALELAKLATLKVFRHIKWYRLKP